MMPAQTDHDRPIPPFVPPIPPNRRLTRLAEHVALAARPLLSCDRTMFLGIVREGAALRLFWWRQDLTPRGQWLATPGAKDMARDGANRAGNPSMGIENAAHALLDWLSGRWPVGAEPAALGIITDGSGVAFSPDHPSPLEPGWLLRHACGADRLREIVPLSPHGPCALFVARQWSGALH